MKKLLILLLFAQNLSAQKTDCWFSGSDYAWSGALQLNDSIRLGFLFQIVNKDGKTTIYVYNGPERITVNETTRNGDSLIFKMPVFDSEFKCKWQSKYEKNDSLSGIWINHARKAKNTIPFSAIRIHYKTVASCPCKPFTGRWEASFSPGDSAKQTKALGIFKDPNCWDFIYGTFLTETGDYRFLSGSVYYDYKYVYLHDSLRPKGMSDFDWMDARKKLARTDTTMELSCFDGAHAFYFKAKKNKDGTISGDFYSGSHWHEKWIAKRNDSFELRHPDSLTYLRPGYDKIDFKFKNLQGKEVSLSDDKFKNKVVIVQIMGSWCPNCMDETKYLAEFYKKYKNKGVEVIALAFEKNSDYEKARAAVEKLQKKFGVEYEILITEKVGKAEASDALPMLNQVMAFPTTIYIDKKGKVRKIHTGFNGPGTGAYYDKWVEQNQLFIEKLLEE
ncbi:MAG: TlpA disulfide reductase family protein [Bacteroidota bacterium]